MENTTLDAWAAAVTGAAIGVAIDRTLNQPQTMNGTGRGYGIDELGNVYPLGQTNSQMAVPSQGRISPWLIIIAVVVIAVESRK